MTVAESLCSFSSEVCTYNSKTEQITSVNKFTLCCLCEYDSILSLSEVAISFLINGDH